MKVYGKVYEKPPSGAKKRTKQVSLSHSEETESRTSSVGDLDLSSYSSRPLKCSSANGKTSQYSPATLSVTGVKVTNLSRSPTTSRNKNSNTLNNSSSRSTPTKKQSQGETSPSIEDDDDLLISDFSHDDELLIQSDQLCKEVLSLCAGSIPIELSSRNSLSPNVSTKIDRDGGGDVAFHVDDDHELLTSLPCMSLWSSAASTARDPPGVNFQDEIEAEVTGQEVSDGKREEVLPENSSPSQRSLSPDYDFSKAFGILRLIDEEEAQGCEISTCHESQWKQNYQRLPIALDRNIEDNDAQNSRSISPSSIDRPNLADVGSNNFEKPFVSELFSPSRIMSPALVSSQSDFVTSMSEETKSHSSYYGQEIKDGLFSSQHISTQKEWDEERIQGSSRSSHISETWENFDSKSQRLFSFLDEVDQSDRDKLFQLKFQHDVHLDPVTVTPISLGQGQGHALHTQIGHRLQQPTVPATASKLDTLIRKGSAELAREILMLERHVEDCSQNVHILEETLLSQRELNIRNMRNSERDSRKRLKFQQDDFELTLSRQQAFVDQLIVEKKSLQEKLEKVLKECKDSTEKYQQQINSLQEKHLEEIKRLRKIQENTEKTKKQKWVGQKTQEIRDLTVKGLEPEVQRLIQRHQQEMAETRAYYSDEIQELEERYARKQTHQLQELRENFAREKDESCRRERELVQKRFEADVQRQLEDFEIQKKRWIKEVQEEKDRLAKEEEQMKEAAQDNIRKGQIRHEVELENVQQEHTLKMSQLENRHEREIQSLQNNFEAQKETWLVNFNKKNQQDLAERESHLILTLTREKENEGREREQKFKQELERVRQEDQIAHELRIKRLQEKFQSELDDLEKSERDVKSKLALVKSEMLEKDEELSSSRATLGQRSKENQDLTEANMRMLEERVNLTSIIRREFISQIESLEQDCAAVKHAVVELKAKHKLDLEINQRDFEKFRVEKEAEIERIGQRVKQTLGRKDETLIELGKELEKGQIRINHLELLLEQQRKDFVKSMTSSTSHPPKK